MQNLILPALVLFSICVNAFSQEAPLGLPGVTVEHQAVSAETVTAGVLPEVNPFADFVDRLKGAIETRDAGMLEALYQTNGVSAAQLTEELNRWEPMLRADANSRVSIQTFRCVFRDLSRANKKWKKLAERLTSQPATHIIELPTSAGYWKLPLVEVKGRLFIVPSDKSRNMATRMEDAYDGAPSGTPPISPGTNSTSLAPDARH